MKIGLLGGAFNPIHVGHLALAKAAYEKLNLNEVWFLPTGNHPLKNEKLLPLKDRVYLLKHALLELESFRISLFDAIIEKPTYSDELIKRLSREYPEYEFYFLVGEDIIPELHNWHNYRWLLDNVRICVFTRNGIFPDHRLSTDELAKITFLKMPPVDISATEIRKKVNKGESIVGLVPDINLRKTIQLLKKLNKKK